MKSKLLLILIATLVVLPIPINALTIVPDSTTCNWVTNYCESIVDLSKYLTTSVTTNIKNLNLTSSLPLTTAKSVASSITNINYKFDGTNLTIFGYIKPNSSTYWTMDLGGYATIDPYWNSSDALTSGPATQPQFYGIKINTTNGTMNLTRVSVAGLSGGNNVSVIRVADNVLMGSTTTKGGTWYNFTPALTLAGNTLYYIVTGKTDWSSHNLYYASPHGTRPNQTENFLLVSDVNTINQHFTEWQDPRGEAYEVNGTDTTLVSGGSNATSITLFLNSSSSNISMNYDSYLNSTAVVNVSYLAVSLLRNGTSFGSGTTSVIDISKFGSGVWNITGNTSGNATFTSSLATYWAIINPVTSNCSLTLNPVSPINYPTSENPVCTCNNLEVAGHLYRNNTLKDSENNTATVLGAGAWSYVCNVSSSQNYTSASNSSTLTVNPSSSFCSLTISPPSPVGYGTFTNTTCSVNTSIASNLWRGFLMNSTNYSANSENNTLSKIPKGDYRYICNATATANYSSCSNTSEFNVTSGNPILNLTFNTSDSVLVGTVINISCNASDTEITPLLFNNTSSLSNPYIYNATTLGYLNFSCNSSATANYSTAFTSRILTVSNVTPNGSLIIHQVLDEKTINPLTFNITVSNSTYTSTTNNVNSYTDNIITGDVTIQLQSGNSANTSNYYPLRRRYVFVPPSSSTNITGYLLDYFDGSYRSFFIVDAYDHPIQNALVSAYRLIGSSQVIVDQAKSDSSGTSTLWLEPTTQYILEFSATGYNSDNITLIPTQTSYKISLVSTTSLNFTSLFDDILYQIEPLGKGIQNRSTFFSFWIRSYNSSLQYYGMSITYFNGTVLYPVQNNTTGSGGGNISVTLDLSGLNLSTVPSNITPSLFMTAWFKKSGYNLVIINTTYYLSSTVVNNSNISIMGIANNMKSGSFQIDQFSFGIISLLITIVAMGMMSRQFSFVGSGFAGIGVQIFFTFLGTYIYTTYWMGWTLLLGITIAVLGIAYLRGG